MTTNEKELSTFPGLNCTQERGENPGGSYQPYRGEDWSITQLLSMLPKVKASETFDRRMAAAFAMELEREVQANNAKAINDKAI